VTPTPNPVVEQSPQTRAKPIQVESPPPKMLQSTERSSRTHLNLRDKRADDRSVSQASRKSQTLDRLETIKAKLAQKEEIIQELKRQEEARLEQQKAQYELALQKAQEEHQKQIELLQIQNHSASGGQ
jgi:hypothetical protein